MRIRGNHRITTFQIIALGFVLMILAGTLLLMLPAAVTLAFISGRKIGLMQRSVMQEAISAPQVGGIVRLTRFIVLTTIGIGYRMIKAADN